MEPPGFGKFPVPANPNRFRQKENPARGPMPPKGWLIAAVYKSRRTATNQAAGRIGRR